MASITKKTGDDRLSHLHDMARTFSTMPGVSPAQLIEELRSSNEASCEPPLDEREVIAIAQRYLPPDADIGESEDLPQVQVMARQLRDITAEALDALYSANRPERIFRRSGALTRINFDEKGNPYCDNLDEKAFRGCLARSCNFVRNGTKGEAVAVPPPLDVVRDCLGLGSWELPPLLGITEAPVMRADGSVLTWPGYDRLTNLYYYPSPKLVIPPIPDTPSADDIDEAAEWVLEPVADFPFDGEASLANAIGTMLTPVLRPMIDGPVPLALFDKPQQGTGASLLAEVISIIATGRAAAMMTAQKDDEGWRKAVTSLLLKGQTVVTVDNVEFDLWAPSLAAILTATTFQDRILGRSEMVTLPNRTTWLATGNNIRLRGDLPRRCIWVRMDAHTARPWLRDRATFKHPNLTEWVTQNRGQILWAILTIARGWVVAGRPEPEELPALGGYEGYCQVVGGVLAFIHVKGFLANLSAMYDETDTETPQWEAFAEAWREALGDKAVTTAELLTYLRDYEQFRAALPDSIADLDKKGYSAKLGYEFRKRKDMQFPNGWALVKAGAKKHTTQWRVARIGTRLSPPLFSLKGGDGGDRYSPMCGQKNDPNIRVEASPSSPLLDTNPENDLHPQDPETDGTE